MRKKAQKNNKLQEIIQLDFVSVPYVFEFLFPVKQKRNHEKCKKLNKKNKEAVLRIFWEVN